MPSMTPQILDEIGNILSIFQGANLETKSEWTKIDFQILYLTIGKKKQFFFTSWCFGPWDDKAWQKSPLQVFPGGGDSRKIWVGVCSALLQNPYLFQTKICDIPQPYFKPEPKFDALFQTCPRTASPSQEMRRNKVVLPNSRPHRSKLTLFRTKRVKIYNLISD